MRSGLPATLVGVGHRGLLTVGCAWIVLAAFAGCGRTSLGFTDGGPAPATNLANFTGAMWIAFVTGTGTCSDGSPVAGEGSKQLTFIAVGPNDIEYRDADGCLIDFSVSRDTATLSNVPECTRYTSFGQAVLTTYLEYTAVTTDGHNLSLEASLRTVLEVPDGGGCNITISGSGTR